MISAYSPVLKNYSSNSPEWYKHFHSVFYMSQLASQTLSSYIEKGIEDDKKDMICEQENDLIKSKIIVKSPDSGDLIVLNQRAFNSIHIEYVIDQLVEKIFKPNQSMLEVHLSSMGLEQGKTERKDVSVDRDLLLNSTTSKNWYELISGLLNVWEFIFLYGAVESAFKSILSKQGQVREEDLLGNIFDRFPNLSNNLELDRDDIEKIWVFYTELRNIYVHNHGFISDRIKANLGGKLDGFKKAIHNIHAESIMIVDLEDILKKDRIRDAKFYFMHDTELNIFRNSMIYLVENFEESCVEALTNKPGNDAKAAVENKHY
jgi:hypothetical protein